MPSSMLSIRDMEMEASQSLPVESTHQARELTVAVEQRQMLRVGARGLRLQEHKRCVSHGGGHGRLHQGGDA